MRIEGGHFIDDEGRRLMLRGLNLGGSSKVPYSPDGRSHLRGGFYATEKVSFVGRPFPLEEADDHFARMARWGQKFLRFLVTWEAIEHEGPGKYDEAYLDYVEAIVEKAEARGISLFVDPHQDVWSRWTGGDGAPAWTLDAVGFEIRTLHASGAALVHQEAGISYPSMRWFSNSQRLACATMFTLFFAGDDFAPGIEAGGTSVQEFLQSRYLGAMKALARRLAGHRNVAGFDVMNEPGLGWIGLPDLRMRHPGYTAVGVSPTAWESLLAGEGLYADAERFDVRGLKIRSTGRTQLGSSGVRAWKDGVDCIWRRAGVWELKGDSARLLRPDWFTGKDSGRAKEEPGEGRARSPSPARHWEFNERYYKPFALRFAREIRAAAPDAGRFAVFLEGVPEGGRPKIGPEDVPGAVNATHWYDSVTLTTKRWTGWLAFDSETGRSFFGPGAVRKYFRSAIARIASHSRDEMGGTPTLVGEFGLPFDMNGRKAFSSGDYGVHERALAAYYDALDASLADAAIWNYTANNTHEHGDGWNREDLSVFCSDEAEGGAAFRPATSGDRRDAGGRALRGFVRPYAAATSGELLGMSFDMRKGVFKMRFVPDPAIAAPTLVFVPRLQFPGGYRIASSGISGTKETGDSGELLEVRAEARASECVLVLRRA